MRERNDRNEGSRPQYKKLTAEQLKKCRFVTEAGRAYYPSLVEPTAMGNSDPKYSLTIGFPKKKCNLAKMKLAIKTATEAQFGKGVKPKRLLTPIIDGDIDRDQNGVRYSKREGYKGHWVVKMTSTDKKPAPGVFKREDGEQVKVDREDVISEIYPGAIVKAAVFARFWEFKGKRGIQLCLDHVLKVGDGEPIGGRISGEEAFADEDSDSDEDEAPRKKRKASRDEDEDEDEDSDEDDSDDEDEDDDSDEDDSDEDDSDEDDDEDEAPRKKSKKRRPPAQESDDDEDEGEDEDEDEDEDDDSDDEEDEDDEDEAPRRRSSKKRSRR